MAHSTAVRQGRAWTRPGLLAVCLGANLLEAVLVLALGPRSGLGLSPQASALAPFGVFHDLRWLVVYHDSWPAFLGEAAGILGARGVLTALTVLLAWPDGVPRPPLGSLLVRGLAFTGFAALLLAPWVILLFGLAVVSVSWLFFAAVPSALAVALLVHHVPVARGWWRRPPAPRALGLAVVTFVVATAAGGVISAFPAVAAVPVAAATGLFNAWAWSGLVRAVVVRRSSTRIVPVTPVGLLVVVGGVLGGTVLGFAAVARPSPGPTNETSSPPAGGGRPVLVAEGFGSRYDGTPPPAIGGPFLERVFSYRGLGPGDRPLPYGPQDTTKPLPELDRMMAEQVAALHRATHRRVSIVAESEGALVAKTYLVATPHAPVEALVMLSPLVDPGRVYYPPSGSAGWGVAAGAGMQGLSDALAGLSPIDLSPESPFLRSLVAEAPLVRDILSCPVAGVRQFALLPLADAVAGPPVPLGVPFVVVPAFHGGMLGNPRDDRLVAAALAGRIPAPDDALALAARLIRSGATAWQVPGLEPDDYPPTSELAGRLAPSCSEIRQALEVAVYGRG
jgi:hypothetical protein